MDNLYIRVDENNRAIGNPILGENVRTAFPDVNLENLPSSWAKFNRIERPNLETYETWETPDHSYEMIDGEFCDYWHKREMTEEEKQYKRNLEINRWNSRQFSENFSSWVFNTETCRFDSPIPMPVDGQLWGWRGNTNSWQLVPPPPESSVGEMDFNPIEWQWFLK